MRVFPVRMEPCNALAALELLRAHLITSLFKTTMIINIRDILYITFNVFTPETAQELSPTLPANDGLVASTDQALPEAPTLRTDQVATPAHE